MRRTRSRLAAALRLHSDGRFADASRILETLVKEQKCAPLELVFLGNCYDEIGQSDKAIECFRKAVELRPKSETISLALFHALWKSGQQVIALDEMKRFVSIKAPKGYKEIIDGIRRELKSKC